MNFLEFLKDYPGIGATSIAIVFGALGWSVRNLVQFFIDNSKYNKELKTYFWKEKVKSAKKASEFYLEHMNYLNLLRHQFEIFEKGKIEHQELYDNIQKEIEFYSNKLKAFPHFEHHHINIFYNFDDERAMEINKRTFDIHRELIDLQPKQGDSLEEIDSKMIEIKKRATELKDNYEEHFRIYKRYLEEVRKDLEGYL
jgi:DNA-binding ferritin-like protein (Dps family)